MVDWINSNKNNVDCGDTKCPIQFLAVLGDITNTAEKSQFIKAKSILDKLNDPNGDGDTTDGIPYVPVFGNHDVWPYTDLGEAASSLGEIYFDEIFWNENATNTKLIQERLNFQRDEVNTKYKNFAFSYKDMNFIGLDFVAREPFPGPGKGVGSDAVLWESTFNWFSEKLSADKHTIIFSHHPLIENAILAFGQNELDKIAETITTKNATIEANFAGHVHGFYDPYVLWNYVTNPYFMNANKVYTGPKGIQVVTTEALMTASNEPDAKGIIRIVEMEDNKISNYDLVKGEDIPALNPYFKQIEWSPKFEGIEWGLPPKIKLDWKVEFELYSFNKLYPVSYSLDFGDGSSGSIIAPDDFYPPEEIVHIYPREGGTYNIELTAAKTTPLIEESITRTITIPRIGGGFFTLSPVDIILTDPEGLIVNKETSEIPGAFYFETDLDDDGELNDIIILPERKIGNYSIEIVPESNTTPTDTYTLGAFTENDDIVFLAQDVQINDIPEQPYVVYSGEEEIIPWNYIFTDNFGRNTILKINTEEKYFSVHSPNFDTGIIKDAKFKVIKSNKLDIQISNTF